MPVLLDNDNVARNNYNIWDRVWFPGDPEVGGADVLSPYPYDVVIDINGRVALVSREYEPDKMITRAGIHTKK